MATIVTTSRTMIAAEVSDWNSCCGLRAQSKMIVGSAVYGPVNRSLRLPPVENEPRTAPTRMSGAVSPIARDSDEHGAGQDAGGRGRQDELADDLPARRAEAEACLAQRAWARRGWPRPR